MTAENMKLLQSPGPNNTSIPKSMGALWNTTRTIIAAMLRNLIKPSKNGQATQAAQSSHNENHL
jgi:hypothetical protein